MGRDWYEREGKLLQKKNTFSDFISCAEHLISTGWTAKGGIAAQGASAGGLLMGCVLNARLVGHSEVHPSHSLTPALSSSPYAEPSLRIDIMVAHTAGPTCGAASSPT